MLLARFSGKIRVDSIQIRVLKLALFWLSGLFIGTFIARCYNRDCALLTAQFARYDASLGLLLLFQVIPLAFAWLSLLIGRFFWIYLICFCKLLIFGFCSGLCYGMFHSAGWLICFLLEFSQVLTLVPLFWLMLRCVCGKLSSRSFEWILFLVMFLLVSVFDRLVISPFLSMLISQV